MKKLLFVCLCFMISLGSYCQSSKKVASLGIKTRTEWAYIYRGNKEIEYKESFKKFDNNGNIIEIYEWDEKGTTTLHQSFTFNENDDVLTETTYGPDGKIVQTDKYSYTGKLKTVRETYDGKSKKISKKIYHYEFKE